MRIIYKKQKFIFLLTMVLTFLTTLLLLNDTSALTYNIPEGYTTITDPNFYDCVVTAFKKQSETQDETIPDTGITDEQLAKIKTIYCYKENNTPIEEKIQNTTGLEKMISLISLNLNLNRVSSIDISNNTALTDLSMTLNQLSSIDTSHNPALRSLIVEHNQITSIDLSKNTDLRHLSVRDNQLTELDVSHNTALGSLNVSENLLTSLDVSKNTDLTELDSSYNQLTSLDASNNLLLQELYTYRNKLTSLKTPKGITLKKLNFSENQLTNIDLSTNLALERLGAHNNLFTEFSIPESTELVHLDLSNNKLSSVDLSKNTALEDLYLSSNQFAELDVSHNTALIHLSVGNNLLTSLDISRNTMLKLLDINRNSFTSIDVSSLNPDTMINCDHNALFDFEPFQAFLHKGASWHNMTYQSGSVVTPLQTYTLPPLFTQVKEEGWGQNYDVPLYTNEDFTLSNLTLSEDGKRVTIIDTTQPASITINGGAAKGSVLKIIYDKNAPVPDPGKASDEILVPNTGRNSMIHSGSIAAGIGVFLALGIFTVGVVAYLKSNRGHWKYD